MTAETIIPTAPTAGEERAAVIAWHLQELARADAGLTQVELGVAAAHRASLAVISAGEHLRGIVDPRPRARGFRETLDRLMGDWLDLWNTIPEEAKQPDLGVNLASLVAARYVEQLDAKGLDLLQEWLGFPPAWSRAHAIGGLSQLLWKHGYGGHLAAKAEKAGG